MSNSPIRNTAFALLLSLAGSLAAATGALATKPSSAFKEARPLFTTTFVPPGSWIVVTASETVEPSTSNVIRSDLFCGLKPGFFVTVAAVDGDRKSAQKSLDRLKSEKKTGYLRNVGAWSNRRPCKDSANPKAWHYAWDGGEISGVVGGADPIRVNQKALSELAGGAKLASAEIFEVSSKLVLLHAWSDVEPSDEPVQADHLILALDGQGKEVLRRTFAVGDDYSPEHVQVARSADGAWFLLVGNPTQRREAWRQNPATGAFEKAFVVEAP